MMQHSGYDRESLSKYRMDTAKEDLKGAEILFNAGEYRMANMISKVELIRHASDYDDFYVASKEETSETIESARDFLNKVDIYIGKRIKQSNLGSEF